MGYIKKLWTTIKVDPEDKNNIIAFTLMQLLINLHHGSKETSPYELYQILINSDFSGIDEQMDSHELLVFLQEKLTELTAKRLRRTQLDDGFNFDWSVYSSKATTVSSNETQAEEEKHDSNQIDFNDILSSNASPE